jgi:hypothetical protein
MEDEPNGNRASSRHMSQESKTQIKKEFTFSITTFEDRDNVSVNAQLANS